MSRELLVLRFDDFGFAVVGFPTLGNRLLFLNFCWFVHGRDPRQHREPSGFSFGRDQCCFADLPRDQSASGDFVVNRAAGQAVPGGEWAWTPRALFVDFRCTRLVSRAHGRHVGSTNHAVRAGKISFRQHSRQHFRRDYWQDLSICFVY
jgi:hypothetical protein